MRRPRGQISALTTKPIKPQIRARTPTAKRTYQAVETSWLSEEAETPKIAAAIHSTKVPAIRPQGIQVASATLRRLRRVRGKRPYALSLMTPQSNPPNGSNTDANSGSPLANRNLCHVSLGAPVIAHTGGKSLAASCDHQT